MVDRTPSCGTPFFNWRYVYVLFLNVVFDVVCDIFENGVRLVWFGAVYVCMVTVSNALLMSSPTVIVRSGGLFWLKSVAMVLFMLCSAVLVEWLILKPCCVEMCGMLFVIYGSSVFSSVFALSLK